MRQDRGFLFRLEALPTPDLQKQNKKRDEELLIEQNSPSDTHSTQIS